MHELQQQATPNTNHTSVATPKQHENAKMGRLAEMQRKLLEVWVIEASSEVLVYRFYSK
jgi:hypothetical protein